MSEQSRRPQLPDGLAVAIYGSCGAALVLLFLPFVWVLSIPLAAFSTIVGWYAAGKYKRTNGMLASVVVSVIVFFAGLSRAGEANESLRRASEDDPAQYR